MLISVLILLKRIISGQSAGSVRFKLHAAAKAYGSADLKSISFVLKFYICFSLIPRWWRYRGPEKPRQPHFMEGANLSEYTRTIRGFD